MYVDGTVEQYFMNVEFSFKSYDKWWTYVS